MLVASYTKCGGSWLTWMLIDILYKPPFFCDLVDKSQLDYFVGKTEKPLDIQPNIHVFRHPLDVVCSAWNYVFLTDRLLGLADNLEPPTEAEFYDNFIEKGSLMFFHENIKYIKAYEYGQWAPIQIKYEDLLKNPKGELKKIIASTPAKRIGTPDEVANVVTFLSSKEASYINGEVVVISGGR